MANKKPNGPARPGPGGPGKPKIKKGTIVRLVKLLFSTFPVLLPLILLCILFSAAIAACPSIFMQRVIAIVETSWQTGDWDSVAGDIIKQVATLVCCMSSHCSALSCGTD